MPSHPNNSGRPLHLQPRNWLLGAVAITVAALIVQQAGGNTIRFTLNVSWRRGYFNNPNVGNVINPGGMYFGDGTSASISATVNSVDVAADIINTTWTVTHTYPAAGNYVVNALNSGDRLSSISDLNHDAPYNLQALVNVGPHSVDVTHHGQRHVFTRPDVFADPTAHVGDGTLTVTLGELTQ